MNYDVEIVAEAITSIWGRGSDPDGLDREEAQQLVAWLRSRGWRITREGTSDEPLPNVAAEGAIQRALGYDGGDEF